MILEELSKKLIEYQKNKDEFNLGAFRYLLSQIKNKEIELRPQGIEINDEIVAKVIKKQLKDRHKTLEMFQKANREDLVDKENREIVFLSQLSEEFGLEVV
jgi:uncharacterized protein YqeY